MEKKDQESGKCETTTAITISEEDRQECSDRILQIQQEQEESNLVDSNSKNVTLENSTSRNENNNSVQNPECELALTVDVDGSTDSNNVDYLKQREQQLQQ